MSTRPSRRSSQTTLPDWLATAVMALPSGRYATACVGIAAAVALVVRSTPSVQIAVLGGTVMLASMVLVALVAQLTSERDRSVHEALRRPAVALAWGVVGAALVVLALLISTTFWGLPRNQGSGRRCQLAGVGVETSSDASSALQSVQKLDP